VSHVPKVPRQTKAVIPRLATPSTRSSSRISVQEADHRRCASYHKRVVVRTDEGYLEPETLWGTVKYLGRQSLPRALTVRFTNGTVEHMTADQVAPILCEDGTEMPEQPVAFPAVEVPTLSTLPDVWVLDIGEKLVKALEQLMPNGGFRKTEVTTNSARMPGSLKYNSEIRILGRKGPPTLIFGQLKRVLRLENVSSWLDPCASTCKLAKLLISPKYKVYTNEYFTGDFDGVKYDANFKMDPTQPKTFRKWEKDGHCLGGFISIPLPRLLDIVLPLAALTTAQVSCFYVPCAYIFSPTSARLAWIKTLQQNNRLLIIMGIPRNATIAETSGVWVCIFRNSSLRSALVDKKYYRNEDCCVFAD
jgi:hypothetical protein